MNREIKKIAKWARSQAWTVKDDAKGYTHFYDPRGHHAANYPATPSNPRRRMAELEVELRKHGLHVPPPSKKEQRAKRAKDEKTKDKAKDRCDE
jgi:hypothetical protein